VTTPAATTPAETTPAETTPAETTPAETTPVTTTPGTTTPEAIPLPTGVTLRLGDSGDAVRAVQQALKTGSIDGEFGPATQQAVVAFQTASGLTADGIVGPKTLAALSSAVGSG
jgi:peptidoglycan hydrolase-like protein with peptidoglycan-binding domain